MCGIAGVIPARPLPGTLIEELLDSLAPRGPDDQGWAVVDEERLLTGERDGPAVLDAPTLVHRRLSIIDLSKAGWQPMASADGDLVLVFNGEVYNHPELREELEALGHTFRSHSDTEVVLAAYAEWGRDALRRFVGMFAFAVADRRRGVLFLARDPFGIKPLYHAYGEDGFAFASDIGTLLKVPGVSRAADPERTYTYLTTGSGLNSFGRGTLFEAVRQVPAAHWMEVPLEGGAASAEGRYWKPDVRPRQVPYDEAVAEVRRRFLDNVRLHMRSDVPIGAALSGGIDSSAIVAAMRHLGPEADLHAFSYIAGDPGLSEERWVDMVVASSDATIHKIRPSSEDLVADLPDLIRAQGEPFGTTSIYAQYRVFQAAHEAGVKVMLDGQGADEILGGYRYYLGARAASFLKRGRAVSAWGFAGRAAKNLGMSRRAIMTGAAAQLVPVPLRRIMRRLGLVDRHLRPPWLKVGWFRSRGVVPFEGRVGGRNVLRARLLDSVVRSSLPGLLRYEDRDSMAFSVESRVPFLTVDFVEYLLSLPEDHLIDRDGNTKRVFRDAMRGLVPDAVLDRRDKVGFATTEDVWLRASGAWVRSVLESPAARRIPFLDRPVLLEWWDGIESGRRPYDRTFWRVLNLILWTDCFAVTYDDASSG